MHHRSQYVSLFVLLVTVLLGGCGKENGSVTGNENKDKLEGIRLSPAPCKATFTQAYQVMDMFGDPQFSIKPGDSFIVQDISSFFGANLYTEFPQGVYDFEVEKKDGGEWPFTLNCVEGKTQTYLAAFSNTTVYSDSLLTQPLCTLTKGTTALTTGPTGFYLVGDFFSNVYHVELGGFASSCQGATGGYVRAPEANVFNASTTLIPINTYQVPMD
jgi:hypothetical protein